MLCPNCSDELVNEKSCGCGWVAAKSTRKAVDPHHGQCSWKYYDGCRCSNLATFSPSISEGTGTTSGEGTNSKWYCAWHYECLTAGLEDKYDTPEYLKWHSNRKASVSRVPKAPEGWKDYDPWQIKGLVIAGVDSLVWKKAPLEMQESALKLMGEWTPPKYIMPDIDEEERKAIQQESIW